MKCYDRCNDEVELRLVALIEKYHPDLKAAEVKVDLVFVARSDDDESEGPVLTLHGVRALAVARVVSAKDRAMGRGDAEITIDRDRYMDISQESKDALLDHELHHFEVMREEDGAFKTDDQHRPRLKMRHHDYDFGWFEAVARRHGSSSVEVQQCRILWEANGQAFFPFLRGASLVPDLLAADVRGPMDRLKSCLKPGETMTISSGEQSVTLEGAKG